MNTFVDKHTRAHPEDGGEAFVAVDAEPLHQRMKHVGKVALNRSRGPSTEYGGWGGWGGRSLLRQGLNPIRIIELTQPIV